MNISIERVLRFVVVAEQLSFTRAAALLGIDQPWLSKQVMQLEEQLGFPLFDRSGTRIALTAEGVELLESAQRLSQAADVVRCKAEEMSHRMQSALKIGASYATYPLRGRQDLLRRFAEVRPNVEVECEAYEFSEEVVEKVSTGELDFGLVFSPIEDRGLAHVTLDVIDMTLGVPQEDPLAQRPSIALADLAGRRVAVGRKDRTAFRYIRHYAWVEEVGAVVVQVPEGRRFIFDAAERDRLFVVCYTPADKLPPTMVQRPIHGPKPYIDLSMVRSKRAISPAGERLWRLAHELGAEMRSFTS